MLVTVVVITRNEGPRLRLVLESLAAQDLGSEGPSEKVDLEVVVVDDASSDETREVLADAQRVLPLRVLRHEVCRGRSAARNDGVRAASGEVVVLLDGDCLASPRLVARHAAMHARRERTVGRGETYHVRSTRFFRDPETGEPFSGEDARVARMGNEREGALVTRHQIRTCFEKIAGRAEPGIYAGASPRRLYELEMRALGSVPEAGVLWMTAPGQNMSMRRADFEAVGGFDEGLTLNEHRELAFRLYELGRRMVPVYGCRSIHMLHRSGWRDPLEERSWERRFYRAHPCLAVKLMSVFWLTLARDGDIPPEAAIGSLEQLEEIVRNGSAFDYDALRRTHPRLVDLDSE